VLAQTARLQRDTQRFVAALNAGSVARAKALFGPTRLHYESIEPVAESFGNLDPDIDACINDVSNIKRELTQADRTTFSAVFAGAASARAPAPDASSQGTLATAALIPDLFAGADPSHNAGEAQRVRALASALRIQIAQLPATRPTNEARVAVARLQRTLNATRVRLQPWPIPQTVRGLAASVTRMLQRAGLRAPHSAKPYGAIDALLSQATRAAQSGRADPARAAAAGAYSLFELGPARRLQPTNGTLASQAGADLWAVVEAAGRPADIVGARNSAEEDTETVATALGDTTVSRATVVADAGVIVFREGLEAVLILAAITASFTGARRRLRRRVLIGGLVGLLATVATYALAQTIVAALGDGGLRLQAITGLLAIAVLLIVTNWFFHKVYWSEWIGRFHRRRKMLEQVDRLGFISGQTAGFLLLGLTSVYREGFETVLFLQNLQVSAGTGATILGVGFGLAATTVVGVVTFALEQKLPYKKMLIATGILIGLVLGIMVGTTIHNLQGLGWIPTSPTSFQLDLAWGRWLGLYANWQGIGAQLAALAAVYGSYALARGLQKHRRRRAISGSALAAEPQTISER
jgi:FTR1 family protein